MHKYLVDMLECPLCHGDLKWDIFKETNERIIQAEILCNDCNAKYPVEDEIALFLTPKENRNDLWEQGNNQLKKYFNENPEIEYKLLNKSLESLNPADKFIRGMLLEEKGEYFKAMDVFKVAYKEIYTKEYIDCWNDEINYLCNYIDSDKPIIDLASGRCYLVEKLAKLKKNKIVATDFSPKVLKRDKLLLEHIGLYKNISLIAFDGRLTPFKDGAIDILTSNLGLSNIEKPKDLIKELRRITKGTFLSINHFCNESDHDNVNLLKKFQLDTFLLESETIDSFKKADFNINILNNLKGKAKPTPKGELIKDAEIDGFPIKETILKWGIIEAK
ncbi:MAG: methyltransferase domain-containing protein [Firmicutes bacterium]|nr:methyltransferase domain-containing protein [Bacillota bacterium]